MEGSRTIYVVLRSIVRFFAGFIALILFVVAWRKLWVEGIAIGELAYGEKVSLSLLLAVIVALLFISRRITAEIAKR